MRLGAFVSLVVLAACLACSEAQAFGLSPFKVRLAPSGPLASQVFELRNEEDYPQAIQIYVERWVQTVTGSEVNTPADDVLAVYPSQFVLKPHSTQAIRVRWTGPKELTTEQPFRLVAEQLPVAMNGKTHEAKAIRFLVTYRAALYVSPEGAREDLAVVDIAEGERHGEKMLAFTVRNSGTAHVLMKKPVLTLKGHGEPVKVDATGVEGVDDENVHAGMERSFMVPWPKGLTTLPLKISLDYDADF